MNCHAISRSGLAIASALLAFCFSSSVYSKNDVPAVVVELGSVKITTLDLEADMQRLSPKQREQRLKDPMLIRRMAGTLLYWRVLAAEAKEAGADKNPLIAAQLEVARDRVLGELYMLSEGNQNYPPERVEALARAEFNIDPAKFGKDEIIRAKHILILSKGPDGAPRSDDEIDRRKAVILAALEGGRTFADVAREFSEDPGSARKGGDLGKFPRGKMISEFDDAAFALDKPGDRSEFIETKFGWHLIQLEERIPGSVPKFEDVKAQAVARTRARLMGEHRSAKAQEMQADPNIIVNEEAIQAFIERMR